MISRIFESLYIKVFVSIVVGRADTTVLIELYSKGKIKNSFEEVFATTDIDENMREFILLYISESPFYYISFLDDSQNQGAIPTCNKNKIDFYQDMSGCSYRCFKKRWSYFTDHDYIYSIERKFQHIGVDYIFSPFLLLANFFKDKIADNLAMFLLIEEKSVSLSVFNNSELLYSEHLLLNTQNREELMYEDVGTEMDESLEEDGIDLEELDIIEELDSLEDFGDIEDLDTGDDFEDFEESHEIEEDFHTQDETPSNEVKSDELNDDYERFSLIQKSINHFYKDDKYESEFIENIYVADGIGISSDFKKYLEEEMFLSVYIRQIDLTRELASLARMEMGL